jgi:hypothetical protein
LLPSHQSHTDGIISRAATIGKCSLRGFVHVRGKGCDVFDVVFGSGGIVGWAWEASNWRTPILMSFRDDIGNVGIGHTVASSPEERTKNASVA